MATHVQQNQLYHSIIPLQKGQSNGNSMCKSDDLRNKIARAVNAKNKIKPTIMKLSFLQKRIEELEVSNYLQ